MAIETFGHEQEEDLYTAEEVQQVDVSKWRDIETQEMEKWIQNELLSLSEGILPSQEVVDGHEWDYDIQGNLVGDLSQFEDMGSYEFVT